MTFYQDFALRKEITDLKSIFYAMICYNFYVQRLVYAVVYVTSLPPIMVIICNAYFFIYYG